MLEILHAKRNDKNKILDFIKNNVSKSHNLLKNSDLFDHYFLHNNKYLQFYVAKDNNKIIGILGYSLTQNYSDIDVKTLYLQMWFVAPNLKLPVGLMLLRRIEDEISWDFLVCLGINKKVLPFYVKLGYKTGSSTQWLLHRKNFLDADNIFIKESLIEPENNPNKIKNIKYLSNKFLDTNFRDYIPFTIFRDNVPSLCLVGRYFRDEFNNIDVFRVVDFTGDVNLMSFLFLYELLAADCIELNLNYPFKNFALSNFEVSNKDNFITLYNEPPINEFRQKNYACKINKKNNLEFYIVSGDCDQDRPNI